MLLLPLVAWLPLLGAAEKPLVVSAEPLPVLDAQFRHKEGWVGGDGVYSVRLKSERTMWLFSDTWIGKVRDGKRRDVTMVNNSVAIEEGKGDAAQFSFPLLRNKSNQPVELFSPPDGRGWFWIYAGIMSHERLQVFLPRFEKTSEPGAFGFRNVDLWLGTVTNPTSEAADWQMVYSQVPFAHYDKQRKRSYGSAVLAVNDVVYIYGYEEKPGRPFPSRKLLIARVPAGELTNFMSWRFFASGDWQDSPSSASTQCEGLATEFSVSYLPGLDRYALVYTENGLSERILGRFSATPVGPWSDPVLLFTCPESRRNSKVFTYAAKAHPHLAAENELVVSYVANGFGLDTVLENSELYWPQFVRVKLKRG